MRAIQVVTKTLSRRPKHEYPPYDANKQKVNGKAQLGGAAT